MFSVILWECPLLKFYYSNFKLTVYILDRSMSCPLHENTLTFVASPEAEQHHRDQRDQREEAHHHRKHSACEGRVGPFRAPCFKTEIPQVGLHAIKQHAQASCWAKDAHTVIYVNICVRLILFSSFFQHISKRDVGISL